MTKMVEPVSQERGRADREAANPLVSAAAFAALARTRLSMETTSPGPQFETRYLETRYLEARHLEARHLETRHRSDFDLNPDATRPSGYVRAAVLVPVVARPQLTVLLTRRSAALAKHAGQIAFPGGRIDPSDPDAVAAALREAHEEIGLPATSVEPLGHLDPYRTATGYEIAPVVALITPDFVPILQESEVAAVFEVPLAHLMDPAHHELHTGLWQGRERRTYRMAWQDHIIWGATAGMLKNFYERLFTP